MDEKWLFKFRQHPPIEGKPVTLDEAEDYLLSKLNDPNENRQRALLELVRFYRSTGRVADAMPYAEEYLAGSNDPEEKAEMNIHLGQAMERVRDWESAIRFYKKALELEPKSELYRYLIQNNIGYSLNQLKRYSEAEKYLREAIALDPSRANSFKNLGLSLEGQGRFGDAARSFMAAVQADASDPRALKHLEELAEQHSEVYADIPDLSHQITRCREVVEYVAELSSKDKPPLN
jgi:tetratricopeptide (TPR) repeat protein